MCPVYSLCPHSMVSGCLQGTAKYDTIAWNMLVDIHKRLTIPFVAGAFRGDLIGHQLLGARYVVDQLHRLDRIIQIACGKEQWLACLNAPEEGAVLPMKARLVLTIDLIVFNEPWLLASFSYGDRAISR